MATVLELGLLAADVYHYDPPGTVVAAAKSWKRLESYGRGGQPINNRLRRWIRFGGFFAALYERSDGKEHVFAVRGTHPLDPSDMINDVIISGGLTPWQMEGARAAFRLAWDLMFTRGLRSEFYLTGHSLGGGLAYVLSAESGFPVVTFNSPHMTGVRPMPSLLARAMREGREEQNRRHTGTRAGQWLRSNEDRIIHVRAMNDLVSSPTLWGRLSWLHGYGANVWPGVIWPLDLTRAGQFSPAYPEPLGPTGSVETDEGVMVGRHVAWLCRLGYYRLNQHFMVNVIESILKATPEEKGKYTKELRWLK